MRHAKIASTANPNIKRAVKLRDRQARDETGLTIVEGFREIQRALENDLPFEELYFCGGEEKQEERDHLIEQVYQNKGHIFETTKGVFSKIAYGNRKEGLLAICKQLHSSFEEIQLREDPIVVIVENVEKPGNLGAILRTCDGAGVDVLIISDKVADVYNPNVIRSSLGTVFSVPVVVSSPEEIFDFLEKNNIKICAAVPDASALYTQVDLSGPLAIAVGSEQSGLSECWKNQSDVQVRVPMVGQVDSLNVSVTTAIIVYEAVRQRTI